MGAATPALTPRVVAQSHGSPQRRGWLSAGAGHALPTIASYHHPCARASVSARGGAGAARAKSQLRALEKRAGAGVSTLTATASGVASTVSGASMAAAASMGDGRGGLCRAPDVGPVRPHAEGRDASLAKLP